MVYTTHLFLSLSSCAWAGDLDVVVEHALHGEGEDAELGEGQHERRDQETALLMHTMTRVKINVSEREDAKLL